LEITGTPIIYNGITGYGEKQLSWWIAIVLFLLAPSEGFFQDGTSKSLAGNRPQIPAYRRCSQFPLADPFPQDEEAGAASSFTPRERKNDGDP
jgi:hypothetical protein